MTAHELLWEMTRKNNFYVRNTKHSWLDGEPLLPSIMPSSSTFYMRESLIYMELLGAKIRNLQSTGAVPPMLVNGTTDEIVRWYIDYPENKSALTTLLEMASRVHDIHGKARPIANALAVIDRYENHQHLQA